MKQEGDEIDRSNQTYQTILDNNTIRGDMVNIVQSIQEGTTKSVSDGSFVDKEGVGSAGWIIEGSVKGNQLQGQNETPESMESQCSLRSEMWGILGIVMSVNALCEEYHITQGSISAKFNGKGTINVLQQMHSITKNSHKHFDIILALQTAIKQSLLKWTFIHL